MSEQVALRLVLPGVVVTWFVTGFPDPGRSAVHMPTALACSLLQDELKVAGDLAMAGTIHAPISCDNSRFWLEDS